MSGRTRPCDDNVRRGRLRKADQFWAAAEAIRELDDEAQFGDVYVTLCVHAGVAAADVVWCSALGEHSVGEDHAEAVALLRRTRPNGDDLAKALSVLLGMKTRAGYGASPVNATDRKRAQRQAQRILRAAQDRTPRFG
jgi:pyrimidine deaminase RibD-like protein